MTAALDQPHGDVRLLGADIARRGLAALTPLQTRFAAAMPEGPRS